MPSANPMGQTASQSHLGEGYICHDCIQKTFLGELQWPLLPEIELGFVLVELYNNQNVKEIKEQQVSKKQRFFVDFLS